MFGIGWYALFSIGALDQSLIVAMLGIALSALLLGERAVLIADGASIIILYLAAFTNPKVGLDQPFLNVNALRRWSSSCLQHHLRAGARSAGGHPPGDREQ